MTVNELIRALYEFEGDGETAEVMVLTTSDGRRPDGAVEVEALVRLPGKTAVAVVPKFAVTKRED